MQPKFCSICGRKNQASNTRCAQCGNALGVPPAPFTRTIPSSARTTGAAKLGLALALLVAMAAIGFYLYITGFYSVRTVPKTNVAAFPEPSGKDSSTPANITQVNPPAATSDGESQEVINGWTVTIANEIPEARRKEICYWIVEQRDTKPGNMDWSEDVLSMAASHFQINIREIRLIAFEGAAKHWAILPQPPSWRHSSKK